MNCKPGDIARIVKVISPELRENLNKLVEVVAWAGAGWDVRALQHMRGSNPRKGLIVVKPGELVHAPDEFLRPLGDAGPEERDLFGVPKPTWEYATNDRWAAKNATPSWPKLPSR